MPTMTLCHFCEFDTTEGKPHDCPFIGVAELEKTVANAAVNALLGSSSITSECRRDAVALVLFYARLVEKECIERAVIDRLLEKAYRYFEYGEELPRELQSIMAIPDDV